MELSRIFGINNYSPDGGMGLVHASTASAHHGSQKNNIGNFQKRRTYEQSGHLYSGHSGKKMGKYSMSTRVVEANVSDENLMLNYRGGDAGAFEILYKRFKAPLHRYFLRQTYDRPLCEELFQEVWLSLIRNRHGYSPDAKFSTYLYRIAHSRLVDHFRRKSNIRFQDVCLIDQLPADFKSQPEHVIELEQRERRLLCATRELPEEQREVFILRAEGGLKLEEIAAVLDVPFETAKSRLRYAIKKLARSLRDQADEPDYKLTGTYER